MFCMFVFVFFFFKQKTAYEMRISDWSSDVCSSDLWQLVVNTATTIVTFLMVFLIQNSQNRDAAAMQAKLDELIRTLDGARNGFIGIEHKADTEVEEIRDALEKENENEAEIGRAHV